MRQPPTTAARGPAQTDPHANTSVPTKKRNRNNQNMSATKRQGQLTTQSGSKCGLAPPQAKQPGPRFPYACGRRLQHMREWLNSVLRRRASLHAPSLQPSWMTAVRRAICLLILRMRRFGHRFRPWRRQIFLRTVGQMSVKHASAIRRDQVQRFRRSEAHPRSVQLR